MGADLFFPFGEPDLPDALVADLRRANPWWEGRAGVTLPRTRRHLVGQIRRRLEQRIAPIVVVRGPRQIGKTIAQQQYISDLLAAGCSPTRILRVQFDELPSLRGVQEPILRIVDWFERTILGRTLNEAAHAGAPAQLFLDEIQNLPDWAPQLKSLVDSTTVQVVVTGSSALRIEAGRDSLAGRITTIEAGTLSLSEIAGFRGIEFPAPFLGDNGLDRMLEQSFWTDLRDHGRRHAAARDETFRAFSDRGSYPIAHERQDLPWQVVADHLNETVVRRVIRHDLRMGERGRKRDEALLEEVFRIACRYAGQSPALALIADEARRALQANVGGQRTNQYLRFLGGSLLLRLIEPLEIRLKRKRGAPKLCLTDHGLRAAWLQELVPLAPDALAREPSLSDLAGHVAESVVGATLCTIGGLDVAHFPERGGEPEVDFVLTIGTRRIPLEVKYQRRIDPLRHTVGLRSFMEKAVYNAPFGILATQADTDAVTDPRIVTLPVSSLLMLR
ncbi:MAG: ATP-binding protein [Candidatus Sumerlaeia bacterium]|nr:ATP-binding protein [Candidatus Sumerlaeia bacterium]